MTDRFNFFAPPRLDTLPPELLLQIFAIAGMKLIRIDICHRLVPFARRALYTEVDAYSLDQIAKLQDAIASRPASGKYVRKLRMSYYRASTHQRRRTRDPKVMTDETDKASELLGGLSLADSWVSSTTRNALDPKRLASFFAAMPNLEDFESFGKRLVGGLFDDSFVAAHPMAKLRSLTLFIRPEEDLNGIDDAAFFVRASRLPLRTIHIHGATEVPVDTAEYEDEDDPGDWPLQPRSWKLEALEFEHLMAFGPGAPFLFQSLSALTSLVIKATHVHPNFSDYFHHLPPTLHLLRLVIGYPHATPLERSTAPTLAPFLATAATTFPKLRKLDLGGTIVSRKLLESLHHLPEVECLHLQHGASLFAAPLLALVQRGSPHRMRSLAHLSVHICHCPAGAKEGTGVEARERWVPNWSPSTGFGRAEAKALVRACRNAVSDTTGLPILIDGAILCALKECRGGWDGLHVCEREGGVSDA